MSRRQGRTLTHWGAYDVTSQDGHIVEVRGVVDDPEPSPLGTALRDPHTARVARPAIRRSWLTEGPGAAPHQRGREPFVEVPWDRALELVAADLDRVRRTRGNQAIYAGSYGWASAGRFHHAQSQLKRFLTLFGGFVTSEGTYSHGAAEVVIPEIVGLGFKPFLRSLPPVTEIAQHTELLVSFGGIPTGNAQIASGGLGRHTVHRDLRRAAERGCRFVSVSPTQGPADTELDADWVPLRPGTDAAVMLAIMHELLANGDADEAFLRTHCSGAATLIREVTGADDHQPKSPGWAAAISDVSPGRIERLARDLATHRSMVNIAWSLQRAQHGEWTLWAAIALSCMLGQLPSPGAGLGFGYGSMGSVGAGTYQPGAPALPSGGPNPVTSAIPVARIADMLLHPGETYRVDGQTRTYPDIDLVYWAGGNPFHHHQDLHRLERAWQRPSTIVVHEPFWTASARRADVVLPTTVPLERRDLGGGSTDDTLVAMEPVLDPYEQARDDHAIFAGLAERLGFGRSFTEGRTTEQWLSWLYERFREGSSAFPDEATFRSEGQVTRLPDRTDRERLQAFLEGPADHPVDTTTGRILLATPRDHPHQPDEHPRWIAPDEWLGAATSEQLHLLSPQPRHQLHGQFDWSQRVQDHRDDGRARLWIHPDDAATRSISDGDVLRVANERGRCFASARLSRSVRPRVVVLPTGAWWDPHPDVDGTPVCRRGNPNVLTRDLGTSTWAQATSAHSCLVTVERVEDAPAPTPHAPPPLSPRPAEDV